jgi:hypothetical protein
MDDNLRAKIGERVRDEHRRLVVEPLPPVMNLLLGVLAKIERPTGKQ